MMRLATFAALLFAVVVVVGFADAALPSGKTRAEFCGSDSDCVLLQTKNGAALKVDGLDLEKDTVEGILSKLPSWFGPRPADFIHKGQRLLNAHETLADQGVTVGDIVKMYKTGNWDEL